MNEKKISRRDFMLTSAAAGVAAATPRTMFGTAPTVITPQEAKPLVISSGNGHRYKNGGDKTCVEKAFSMITSGEDVLDALMAGVNIVELDPEDSGVGYGGQPNADGVVQLDSCCM
ncbi:MAG: isoaspartyl peptidase/L-asparaginase, partial [Acidobacteriota bacterium]